MSQHQNDSTKTLKYLAVNKTAIFQPGRRGEAKYQNVCIACRLPNTKKLVTFKRADGRNLSLCRKHARAYLGEI